MLPPDYREAIGYHGTASSRLDGIRDNGLRPTVGEGHWLGSNAIYLFEEPSIALGWAQAKSVNPSLGEYPIVLRVSYDPEPCLDLTRLDARQALAKFARTIGTELVEEDSVRRVRQNGGRRELDSIVLESFQRSLAGSGYRSIRAIFTARGFMSDKIYPPSGPLYALDDSRQSWFNYHDHIQVAVLDPSAIKSIAVYDHSGIKID